MADETDYIAGYDPFFISSELRNKKTDADLDSYYKAATGGGVAADGNYLFGFPRERLVVNRPNPDKYAMGLKSRRADFERDTANYKQDSAQLQALIAAEKQRRAYEASIKDNEDYLDFYSASSPEIDAAVASNTQAKAEYINKPYGFFGGVREAFTGERAALDREYAANYERKLQLGDLKSELYAADKTGGELPQELLDQYQSVGGEPYQRKFSSKEPAAEPEPAPVEVDINKPRDSSGSMERIESAEPKAEAPQAKPPKDPNTFLDAVNQQFEELRIDDSPQEEVTPEAPTSAEVEPANEEDMAQWRETLKNDFVKVMGSSYDPNSSMDFKKMKLLADTKRANPELSTNALALKIYRSGAL
jgi:cell division septation protein DedD